MLPPETAQNTTEAAVLNAAAESLELTQAIEDALTLARPWSDEPLVSRAQACADQAHILALLYGPDWHLRPEAVALLT